MASPITQRVKSYAKQTQDNLRKDAPKIVVNDQNQLGYNLEDKSQIGAEAPALVESSDGQVVKASKQRCGIEVPNDDPRCVAYNAMSKDEIMASEQKQGLREGYVSQDDADAQNAANQEANNQNKEYGNFKPIELENKYQDVQSRSEVMNQVRRNRSLQRNIKRENNKARRALNKKKRKGTLSEQDVKDLTYYNDNRYTSGTGGNVVRDADGNITGSNLENAMGDMSRSIGTQLRTSGGSINDNANREEILRRGINSTNNQKVKTGYIQKGYSGFQQNPKSYKKQVGGELLDKAGNKIGDVSKTGSFSKVGSDVVPYKGPKVKSLGTGVNNASSTGTKLLNKVNKGINSMPNKGKAGLFKKGALALTTLAAGYFGGKAILGSSDSDDKPKPPTVTPPKKGKSYDQAYQDRDRKTYGHMNKSNYIKEAKRQNDVFAKTGKWDYKNAPKDPGPVSTIKPAKVAPVSTNVKPEANVNLDKISQPERKPTISNKQGKALNKLSKLEGRKQTSRRDIRIAKQKDKAAGLSRKQVRQNKQMRKAGNEPSKSQSQITMPRVMNSSQYEQVKKLGNGSAIDAVTSGKVTIKGLEDQLKLSAGFKQKGWSGYQK